MLGYDSLGERLAIPTAATTVATNAVEQRVSNGDHEPDDVVYLGRPAPTWIRKMGAAQARS